MNLASDSNQVSDLAEGVVLHRQRPHQLLDLRKPLQVQRKKKFEQVAKRQAGTAATPVCFCLNVKRDLFGRGAASDDEVLVFFDLFGQAVLLALLSSGPCLRACGCASTALFQPTLRSTRARTAFPLLYDCVSEDSDQAKGHLLPGRPLCAC